MIGLGFEYLTRNHYIIICSLFIFFPLCLIKDMHKMRYASYFGIIAIFYTLSLIIVNAFTQITYHSSDIIFNAWEWLVCFYLFFFMRVL